MATTQRTDPLRKFKFSVTIASGVALVRGGFSKVSGLAGEHAETTYREGGDSKSPRKLPGMTKWEDVTLERGVMEDFDLWNLFAQVAENNVSYRFEMTITQNDPVTDKPVKGWVVHNCWGKRFELDEHDANSNDVLAERLVIAHEGIEPIKL